MIELDYDTVVGFTGFAKVPRVIDSVHAVAQKMSVLSNTMGVSHNRISIATGFVLAKPFLENIQYSSGVRVGLKGNESFVFHLWCEGIKMTSFDFENCTENVGDHDAKRYGKMARAMARLFDVDDVSKENAAWLERHRPNDAVLVRARIKIDDEEDRQLKTLDYEDVDIEDADLETIDAIISMGNISQPSSALPRQLIYPYPEAPPSILDSSNHQHRILRLSQNPTHNHTTHPPPRKAPTRHHARLQYGPVPPARLP